jgi:4,5-DOPA dioxygenase extradiol
MMPSLFICHGAPSLAIEKNDYTDFLNTLSHQFAKPTAIVIFSAHWENDVQSFTDTDDQYETIYDFHGFPEELHRIKYPAHGCRETASKLRKMFEANGIAVNSEATRGLDHGAWVILHLMYPEANVPVIEVSINPKLSPKEQYKIGQSITALREENILIIGSGATVHNLRMLEWDNRDSDNPTSWAEEFDDWIVDKVEKWDLDALFAYEALAPHARLAIPRNEHFVPLFIAMGSADDHKKTRLLHRSYDYGTLSMICYRFD